MISLYNSIVNHIKVGQSTIVMYVLALIFLFVFETMNKFGHLLGR